MVNYVFSLQIFHAFEGCIFGRSHIYEFRLENFDLAQLHKLVQKNIPERFEEPNSNLKNRIA